MTSADNDCGHHDNRHLIWAMRLALAGAAGRADAYNEINDEIDAGGGCLSCVLSCALDLLLGALEDMHGGDTDAAVAWLERELDNELDRVERRRMSGPAAVAPKRLGRQ
jgi:hypothetical protein